MGLSSRKTTQTNKPVYSAQIEGAANNLNSTYAAQAPKIGATADMFLDRVPGLLEQAGAGDPAVNAASGWITDTLAADPANNPFLDAMVERTNRDVGNQTATSLGTRGLSGGSVASRIIADRLAANETGLRYTDYNNTQSRQAQAAGMAPGIAAGKFLGYAPALSLAQYGTEAPMDAASRYAAGVGGLLGQYQTQTSKQKGSVLDAIGQAAQIASLFMPGKGG